MARVSTTLQSFFRHPHAYYGYISGAIAGMSMVTLGLQLPNFQPAEMLISFLPLWFFCETITLLVAFGWTSFYHQRPLRIRMVSGLLLLAMLLHWGYQGALILDHAYPQYLYSNVWQPKIEAPLSAQKIRIAFFNKYYFNQEYQEISQRIIDLGIDVIGMSEISEIDYQEMKKRLPFQYSYYTNCHCKSSIGSELALFSHYPLDSVITNQLPASPSIKATVSTGTSAFSLLVLHTHAPTSGEELAQRNKTLTALGNQIHTDQSQPLVVMGDLNTSNWSAIYRSLLKNNPHIRDIARGSGLLSTWNTSIFETAIDHMWMSNTITVNSFTINGGKMGSDHHMIWSEIQL